MNDSAVKYKEKLFYIFTLILLMNAFVSSLTVSGEGVGYEENKSLQYLLVVVYGVVAFLFLYFRYLSRFIRDLATPVFFVSVWAVASSFWSSDLLFSLQKSIALFLTAFFGYYLFVRLTFDEYVGLIGTALSVVVLSSFIICILLPSIGVDQGLIHNGSWKGVFPQKQVFAQILALYIAYLFALNKKYNRHWMVMLFVAVFCLLKTGSATGIVISSLVAGINGYLMLMNRLKNKTGLFFKVAIIFVLLCMLVFANYLFIEVFGALGKDFTFSGRVYLWEIAFENIELNPIIGYGYKNFWQSSSEMIFMYLNYYAVNAHNSLLDIWLDLGLIGLIPCMIILYLVGRNSFRRYQRHKEGGSLFVFFFVFLVLSFSTVATVLPNQNTHIWLFLVSFYFFYRFEDVN